LSQQLCSSGHNSGDIKIGCSENTDMIIFTQADSISGRNNQDRLMVQAETNHGKKNQPELKATYFGFKHKKI
jgi:hypothetical protein